ncbi:MAG TPA: hypothetical protein VEG61_08765 [Candidatus Dormibacteraeota bacterium]|nr:hypothetical protein [Candidatus Dormibacteraeota bacterium]
MKSKLYTFSFRTGEVTIDHNKCARCENYACIKADSLFGTGLLRIQGNKPVLATNSDEAKRICSECLACEIYCQAYGNGGLRIKLDMFGLDQYRSRLKI